MNQLQFAQLLNNTRPAYKCEKYTSGLADEWVEWRRAFLVEVGIAGWDAARARREIGRAVKGAAQKLVRDIPLAFDGNNVAPVAVWLGSADSGEVTGQIFEVMGGRIRINETWRHGPMAQQEERWDPTQLGPVVRGLLAQLPEAEAVSGAPDKSS